MKIEYPVPDKSLTKKLVKKGWVVLPKIKKYYRDVVEKDFPSIADAIMEVEKILKCNCLEDEDCDGGSLHAFYCRETMTGECGWGLGQFLFKTWHRSPRKVLEELNKLKGDS